MAEKVLFVDRSSLSGSVVKILARNILLLTNEKVDVHVVKLEALSNYRFTDEKIVLVDPLVSLDNPIIRRYIPKNIKVMNFKISSYTTLNAQEVIEQIENPDRRKKTNGKSNFFR